MRVALGMNSTFCLGLGRAGVPSAPLLGRLHFYGTPHLNLRKRLFGTIAPKMPYSPSMGRPRIGDTRKMITLPAELARAIEDYRFESRLKTEAEAIRQLIEAGLNATAKSSVTSSSSSGPSGQIVRTDQDAERGTLKPSRPRKFAPRAKAAAMSKGAQLRALQERDLE